MSAAPRQVELDDDAVGELRDRVRGPVHRRGESGYCEEVAGFNSSSPANPRLVVGAMDEADVQEAVRWAGRHGVTVHPQATGHGAYRRFDHGMMLKTTRIDHFSIDADARRWTMGAGLRWRDVLPRLHAEGLGAVTGSAPGVGPVGLTLGGGIGPIGRTFGMAGDWVRGYRVVLADGEVAVVDADTRPDLFWALRGGKVGLGVITEITFETLPMPFLYGGGIHYAESEVDRLLHQWIDWSATIPESVSTSVAIVRLPESVPAPLGGRTWLHFRFAYAELGASHDRLRAEGERWLTSWRAAAGPGVVDSIGILPSDRVGEIHQDPTEPLPLYEYGEFLDRFDHAIASELLEQVGGGIDSPVTNLEVRRHGGAYAREPEHPSAIGGRMAPFTFLVVGHPDEVHLTTERMDAAAAALQAVVDPHRAAQVNVNWANPLTAERFQHRLWAPEVRDRLAAIRAEVDPEGRFEFGFGATAAPTGLEPSC